MGCFGVTPYERLNINVVEKDGIAMIRELPDPHTSISVPVYSSEPPIHLSVYTYHMNTAQDILFQQQKKLIAVHLPITASVVLLLPDGDKTT